MLRPEPDAETDRKPLPLAVSESQGIDIEGVRGDPLMLRLSFGCLGADRFVKKLNWIAIFLVASLSVSWAVGIFQQPAQKPKPPAGMPAARPGGAAAEEIPPAAPDALFPALVARVNSKPILGRELEQRVRSELNLIGSPAWKNLREDYRLELTSQSLGTLIAAELLYQKAVAAGVAVSSSDVRAEFTKVQKSFASDAEMNVALANRGSDRDGLLKDLEKTLTVARFVDEHVSKKISVAPEEAAEYYKTHTDEFRHPDMIRTSHILIMVPEGATEEQDRLARQRAEALFARARKGDDFAKLAQENSMDPSASQGGDIGMVPKGQLDPAYESAAFELPVGGMSGPVRSRFGYHIIKVTEKKKEGLATFEEAREDLIRFLKNQRVQVQVGQLVDQLRKEARIEVYIPVAALPGTTPPTASSPRP